MAPCVCVCCCFASRVVLIMPNLSSVWQVGRPDETLFHELPSKIFAREHEKKTNSLNFNDDSTAGIGSLRTVRDVYALFGLNPDDRTHDGPASPCSREDGRRSVCFQDFKRKKARTSFERSASVGACVYRESREVSPLRVCGVGSALCGRRDACAGLDATR